MSIVEEHVHEFWLLAALIPPLFGDFETVSKGLRFVQVQFTNKSVSSHFGAVPLEGDMPRFVLNIDGRVLCLLFALTQITQTS